MAWWQMITDKRLSEVINAENIDVPGLVRILERIEERLANIEEALEMYEFSNRVYDK